MNLFVISPCLLSNIDTKTKTHYTSILNVFADTEKPQKVAIDKNNKLLTLYENIAVERKDVSLMGWLRLMSKVPDSFERIVDVKKQFANDKELCLFVCKHIVNKRKPMIVWSRQAFAEFNFTVENEVEYEGSLILLLDRDEAKNVLSERKIVIEKIENSAITLEGNINNPK